MIIRMTRWLGLVILALSASWLLVTCRYTPPLEASSGVRLRWATAPSFFESYQRSLIRFAEMPTWSCQYRLLGWANSTELYYQQICPNSNRSESNSISVYNLDTNLSQSITEIQATLSQNKVSQFNVLPMVRANGVRPIEYELMMRDMYLKDESLASPDLKHIAVVTRWLFGPEDVMILTQEE